MRFVGPEEHVSSYVADWTHMPEDTHPEMGRWVFEKQEKPQKSENKRHSPLEKLTGGLQNELKI